LPTLQCTPKLGREINDELLRSIQYSLAGLLPFSGGN